MTSALAHIEQATLVRGLLLTGGLLALYGAWRLWPSAVAPLGAMLLTGMFVTTLLPASAFEVCKPTKRAASSIRPWGSSATPSAAGAKSGADRRWGHGGPGRLQPIPRK